MAGRGLAGAEPEAAAPTAVADLMAALRASVERARAARAGSDPTTYASPNGAARTGSAAIAKRTKGTAGSKPKKAPKRKAHRSAAPSG